MTPTLIEFVVRHTQRGMCICGRCADAVVVDEPTGHTVDTGFFKVCVVGEPSKEEFIRHVNEFEGVFTKMNPLDGRPHDYTQIGAWIGDQGLAMQCMALGHLLGVWHLLSQEGAGCLIVPFKS